MRKSNQHMKRVKRHRVAMSDRLCRISKVLKPGDVKYLYDDPTYPQKVFAIRSPITDMDQRFYVSLQAWHAKCVPHQASVLIEWFEEAQKIMDNARDLQPFNDEIRPFSQEECQKFGVKKGANNPFFPKETFYGIDRSKRLYGLQGQFVIDDAFEYLGVRNAKDKY